MDCDMFQQDEIETQSSTIPLFHPSIIPWAWHKIMRIESKEFDRIA